MLKFVSDFPAGSRVIFDLSSDNVIRKVRTGTVQPNKNLLTKNSYGVFVLVDSKDNKRDLLFLHVNQLELLKDTTFKI